MNYSLFTIQFALIYTLSLLTLATAYDPVMDAGIMDYRSGNDGSGDNTQKIIIGVFVSGFIIVVMWLIYRCGRRSEKKATIQTTNQQQHQNNFVIVSMTAPQTMTDGHHTQHNESPLATYQSPPPYYADNIRPPNY